MTGRRLRWLVAGFLASGGAGLLTLTATMNAGFAYGSDESAIMGGTFDPDPDLGYMHSVSDLYINPPPSGPLSFQGNRRTPGTPRTSCTRPSSSGPSAAPAI